MTKEEEFYRKKYPKVKELSLIDKEIINLLREYKTSVNFSYWYKKGLKDGSGHRSLKCKWLKLNLSINQHF